MTMSFKDHFSRLAARYAVHRPTQPLEVVHWVAGLAPRHDVAWDCATGSGQAAVGLASHFARVIATDASEAQVAHATRHPRITYHVAPAEASGIAGGTVDLVTVAQAAHWLDLEAFYGEVRRVAAPGAVLALWAYGDARLDEPALDEALRRFSGETVGPYWPPERRLVDEEYRTIRFPFAEERAPAFTLERRWTLAELAGYLRTWSATARYHEARGRDPVLALEEELAALWGDPSAPRLVRWPIALRAGRVA
ncbi:MAG TPA: class I SAM-dependent methyltransferase [Gemmatimonadaceae bacterium]|nr:class I SAM-dependent methyltransferase [Gemmatimonadaceae bacterium]